MSLLRLVGRVRSTVTLFFFFNDTATTEIYTLSLHDALPIYINFILLGEIVRRVSGQTLPDFARQNIFAPLAMSETMFQPPESLRGRIAPTERPSAGAPPLRGVVHDPTSRLMDCVAGHAGLVSTAADLAKFAEMMLGKG